MRKHKKIAFVAIAALLIVGIAISSATAAGAPAAVGSLPGPIVDKLFMDVKMDESVGILDVAKGTSDVFLWGVNGPTYINQSEDVKAKLDVYNIPSGSWSLILNPVPNKAPFQVKAEDGATYFNPFAMQEIRFALNFLINRKQIVDEILNGTGGPMFSMATPGQPGTYKYSLIASKFGFSATGDEAKAIADIDAAFKKAAALPENAGKLVKGSDGFWQFDGKPVSIKFLIRVDDPNGRLKEGKYVANQIEKAGIKVERLEFDRKKCIDTAYNTNPASYLWNMYTEGWGAGATRAWWDQIVCQMYAPWYTNMPGGADPANWNYEQPEVDEITKRIYNGQYLTEKEYWDGIIKAAEIGIKDSVRIYVAYQQQYYVARKDRFVTKMAYGIGDGLNSWSFITANVKPEADGSRVLKVSQFSAKGSLFMSAWDPVGVGGFNDMYSQYIANPLTDMVSFEAPNTAADTPYRGSWAKVDTKISKDAKGALVGGIKVPAAAVIWNDKTGKWESGVAYKDVGDGKYDYVADKALTAFSTGTYTYKLGKWHNGRAGSVADLMYAAAFPYIWAYQNGDADKAFEETYASSANPALVTTKGLVVNKDGTITTYFDFNFPMSKDRVGATGMPGLRVVPQGIPVAVGWEVLEAMSKMVTDGGKSGTVWSFSDATDKGTTEVHLLNKTCVADIKAKLEEFIAKNYVPASIAAWVKVADAIDAYKKTIAFIDKYGHAYISNGPFVMTKFDTTANYAELSANRDTSYPFKSGYWNTYFDSSYARINSVKVVALKGADATVTASISSIAYPAGTAKPAATGVVNVILVAGGKETVYAAKGDGKGTFVAKIPKADLAKLAAGAYTVVVQAAVAKEAPAVEAASLTIVK